MSEDQDQQPSSTVPEEAVEVVTTIPGMGVMVRDSATGDSYTSTFEVFRTRGTYIGHDQAYGGTISDRDRFFYSLREPVGYWWVHRLADDIWDNWFVIRDVNNEDSDDLDKQVQKVLLDLKAKVELPRETVFERRYGTSILLLSYSSDTDWESPLNTANGAELLQITPYPWTMVNVSEVDDNDRSLRFGLPMYYEVTRGSSNACWMLAWIPRQDAGPRPATPSDPPPRQSSTRSA